MTNSRILGYLCNCFLLLLPVLVFNLLLAKKLPAAYQADVFWSNIPQAISVPENLLRMAVMMLPVFMVLQLSRPSQKLGLALYLFGLAVYFASWTILIASPQSAWSRSAVGFMAPAFTPAIWLCGIGLIGDRLQSSAVPYKPWMYWTVSAFFLLFHNLHAATVYGRRA
jgi:hypothetical protein